MIIVILRYNTSCIADRFVSFNCISSCRQDITQFLMKFVAQLTYHIGYINVLACTCGFRVQDVFSSADLKQ
jgi:hypothetical protein